MPPHHHVARARPGQLLFSDPVEGARLWRTVLRVAHDPMALVLMPDHLHLVHPADVRRRLGCALGGYVRWRNRRRGRAGSTVPAVPPTEVLADRQKVDRALRYVHLNPCRARLVADPLAWPWSTHRDAVGLSLDPAVTRHPRLRRFHAYVSGDPHVAIEGTPLPDRVERPPTPATVAAVVASLARVPTGALRRRGRWRRVYLGVARALCDATKEEVCRAVGASRGAVVHPPRQDHVRIVAQAVHDPRMQDPITMDWPRRYQAYR